MLAAAAGFGQYSRGAWTAFGGDAQRTGWNKIETEITPETAPKLKLEWSIKLDNAPMAMNGLTAPLARASGPARPPARLPSERGRHAPRAR